MKQLTCEMCGSTDLIKQDGVFICQTCGCKYSIEEAKKMMVEGTVEVRGTVQVDTTNQKENLLKRAEIALQDGKFDEAEICANKILDINAECGEAYEVLLLSGTKTTYNDLLRSPKNIIANENYAKVKMFGAKELFAKYEAIQNNYYENEYQKALTLYNSGNCTCSSMYDARMIILPLAVAEYKDSNVILSNISDTLEKATKKLKALPEENYEFIYGNSQMVTLCKEGYVIITTTNGQSLFYFWDIQKIKIETETGIGSKTITIYGKDGRTKTDKFSLFMCDNKDWIYVRKAIAEIIKRMEIVGNTAANILGFNGYWQFFDKAGSTHNVEVKESEVSIVETKDDGTVKNTDIKYSDIVAIKFGSFVGNQYKLTIKCKGEFLLVCIFTKEDGKAELEALYSELKKKAPRATEKTGGCYVATCVYGSYDCPQVWTLRRYRDDILGSTWYGRVFIKLYYAISPTLVKWFGKTKWFKKLWKSKLDRMVAKLQNKGIEDTPYEDKEW